MCTALKWWFWMIQLFSNKVGLCEFGELKCCLENISLLPNNLTNKLWSIRFGTNIVQAATSQNFNSQNVNFIITIFNVTCVGFR